MFGTVWTSAKMFLHMPGKGHESIFVPYDGYNNPEWSLDVLPESGSIGVYLYTYSHSQRLVPIHMCMYGINMCI